MPLWSDEPVVGTVTDADLLQISQAGLFYLATRGQLRQQPGEDLELAGVAGTTVNSPQLKLSGYNSSGVKRSAWIFLDESFDGQVLTLYHPFSTGFIQLIRDGRLILYGGTGGFLDHQSALESSNLGALILRAHNNGQPAAWSQGKAGQTADLHQFVDGSNTVLAAVAKNGAFKPASLADANAENNTLYYSTDAGKLVYKDGGGVVNNLY